MVSVRLEISDPANRLTLKTLLEAEGHRIAVSRADVTIADDLAKSVDFARQGPTLALVPTSQLREAVHAMSQGVYGYVCVPFIPGEAALMVARATAAAPRQNAPALKTLRDVEARHIRAVLRACKGNQAEAARVLGIGRNTLWRKLRNLGQEGSGRGPGT
ncbi:MAG: hypothetical protein IT365_01115 [Candidatus Hydrogenedentes bacterium]|nr:hypothetical protein [Candidatus Hydrogenedentota bacterium]